MALDLILEGASRGRPSVRRIRFGLRPIFDPAMFAGGESYEELDHFGCAGNVQRRDGWL